ASNKKEHEQKFTPPSTSSFTQHHQSTSTSSTSFKAKITIKRRPVAKRYGKNIDQICSTSTGGNRRSSSSSSNNGGGLKKRGMKKKNVVKKVKKNDSSFASDTSFFHSYGGRRSSTPFLGKDVQLFICIHCPAGSHLKYTNENDYRLHVLARHRIVTNDYCDKFFDDQQQNALERATEWVVHRLEVHGTECEENCATIIEKIFASPTHKNGKKRKKMGVKKSNSSSAGASSGSSGSSVKVKKEI
uniref:C2H2-type domain-containing protein n=1 Tax=Meloidogyne javanica TaxID=6303 RepID=A0A915MYK0_MELJA